MIKITTIALCAFALVVLVNDSYAQTTQPQRSNVETIRVFRADDQPDEVKTTQPNYWGLKTNLLYGAYTYTPNLSVEFGVGPKSTLEIGAGYNPWNLTTKKNNNKKLVHWLGQVEYRYWLCQKFAGHFFGVHALGTQFNISGHELPLLFEKGSKNYRYEGYGYGGGISYGYHFYLGKRWNLETTIGVGYARLHYDKYECHNCGRKAGPVVKNYFGPTKAGISLIYLIK